MRRILLYTKDIQAFTGKSDRASRLLIKKIRTHYCKGQDKPLTVVEFCEFMQIPPEQLWPHLK